MNPEPPTRQLEGWRNFPASSGPTRDIILAKGFFEGWGYAEASGKGIEMGEEARRIAQLEEDVKTIINLVVRNDIASASEQLDQAISGYCGQDVEVLDMLWQEITVTVFFLRRALADATVPLDRLYEMNRLSVPPIPHMRSAIYALMLMETDLKNAARYLITQYGDDRQLILALMQERDPGVCRELNAACRNVNLQTPKDLELYPQGK